MSMSSDPALWEMFRAEVDTHMAALNDGLLALEKDPAQGGYFDSLMRAAHSIKGAAKIVGIPTAVEVAHVLEDCFVAARDGRVTMSSRLVDVLFAGVDLLGRVAQDDHPETAVTIAPKVREVSEKIAKATERGGWQEEPPVPAVEAATKADEAKRPTHRFEATKAFDAAWTAVHHGEVALALRQNTGDVCFDFSRVESIDPIGLAFLRQMQRAEEACAASEGIEIRLMGVSSQLADLLRATGLDRGLQIVAAEG